MKQQVSLIDMALNDLIARMEAPLGEGVARGLLSAVEQSTHGRECHEIAAGFGLIFAALGAVANAQNGVGPRSPEVAEFIAEVLLQAGKPGYAFQELGAALILLARAVGEDEN